MVLVGVGLQSIHRTMAQKRSALRSWARFRPHSAAPPLGSSIWSADLPMRVSSAVAGPPWHSFGGSQPAHYSVPWRLSGWPRAACRLANEKKGRVASALHSHMPSSYLLAAGAAGVAASCILLDIAVPPCFMVPIGIEAESADSVAAECLW